MTLTEKAAATAMTGIVSDLASRGRIEQWYRSHPEIEQQTIRGAIVVFGLPRTGTPEGRAFGNLAHPTKEGAFSRNDGYVFQDGRMYPAFAMRIPWLREIVPDGEIVTVDRQSELDISRIEGVTAFSTFRIGNPDVNGPNLHQGGIRYSWDDQSAYSMIERLSPATVPAPD